MNWALPISLLFFVPIQYTKPTQRRGFSPLHTRELPAGARGNKSKSGSSLLPDAEEGRRIQRWETLRFSPAQPRLLSLDATVTVKVEAATHPAVPAPRAGPDPRTRFPELRDFRGVAACQ